MHGAAPNRFMTHLAIQEVDETKPRTWLEHVTDENTPSRQSPTDERQRVALVAHPSTTASARPSYLHTF